MVTAADIRVARARIDETQEQFAARFGVHRSTLAGWEKDGPPDEGAARALINRVLAELAVQASEAAE
jgi:DNA-binding transcriptional regulator YiaG